MRFRRIDLAATVAVLLVVATLVAPAIQQSRENQRRALCATRLGNLGIALNAYHDHHRVFTPGIVAPAVGLCGWNNRDPDCRYVVGDEGQTGSLSHASGLTLLLPFMVDPAAPAAYASYNLDTSSSSMANGTAVSTRIAGYLCPGTMGRGGGDLAAGRPTPTDFVFSAGGMAVLSSQTPFFSVGQRAYGIPGGHRPAAGAFGINSSVMRDTIKDGLAATFLMGESVGELPVGLYQGRLPSGLDPLQERAADGTCEQFWSQGLLPGPGGNRSLGAVLAVTAFDAWYDSNRILVGPAGNWTPTPLNEGGSRLARPTWLAQSLPNGLPIVDRRPGVPSEIGSVQGFRSPHSGNVQFLMADGSVQAVADTIDAKVLVALSSVNGREQLP